MSHRQHAATSLVYLAGTLLLQLSTIDAAPAHWKHFTSRGGWSVNYPATWQIGSCNNCKDLADPDTYVFFYDPKTEGGVMITPLYGKPKSEPAKDWLNDVKQTATPNPQISEEWVSLAGTPALKVITQHSDHTQAENIYVVHGEKTFAIRASPVGDSRFYPQYLRMLATFRFSHH